MLMPSRVKYRKSHRGRMKGRTKAGGFVSFGEYGLQALESHWITAVSYTHLDVYKRQVQRNPHGAGPLYGDDRASGQRRT